MIPGSSEGVFFQETIKTIGGKIMNQKQCLFSTIMMVLLVIVFAGTGNMWSAEQQYPVAEEYFNSEGAEFYPVISYNEVIVAISFSNGQVTSRKFPGGKSFGFSIGEDWGAPWKDGNYTYELRAMLKVDPNGEYRDPKYEGIYIDEAVVQNGHFYIENGRIVPREEEEKTARQAKYGLVPGQKGSSPGISSAKDGISSAKDVCYNDDLIVDGSLCVGFDCTCNYSFGFDTIVLKENNLRIFFDDTSVAASYPRNDWRIMINDSANGGASYFGVEDASAGRRVFTLEAGAPTHSLYVDDGGRLGLGTSTPSVEIHTKDGDTPTLRLEQDGSSGFAPQTWDVAGNETNFFVRDVTHGSTLPFRIQPDAPSSVLTIRADGKVGHGTWGPSYQFHQLTDSSTNAQFVAERASGAKTIMAGTAGLGYFGTLSNHSLRFAANDMHVMDLNPPGATNDLEMQNGAVCTSAGVWTDASSRELKENINTLKTEDALKTFAGLEPVTYNYKRLKDEQYVGFIAEDVPELVAVNGRKGLAPMDIVAVLTKVLQEQQKVTKEQQNTIKELKHRLSELEKKQNK
jgi:endosialidase-like protein